MQLKPTLPLTIALLLTVATSCSKPDKSADSREGSGASGEYPLTTCVVSGETLGAMGAAVEYDHEGTTVKFCCKSCIPEFEASPEKFLAKLR
jgi:YHS domain-containing protein